MTPTYVIQGVRRIEVSRLREHFVAVVFLISMTAAGQGPLQADDPLRYQATESPLLYQADLKAELGDRWSYHYSGTLAYELSPSGSADMKVMCRGKVRSVSPNLRSDRPHNDVFPVGPVYIPGAFARCTISNQGIPVRVEHPHWVFELPFDYGRLPFPRLSDDDKWTTKVSVSLVRNVNYPAYLRLVQVSPAIRVSPSEQPSGDAAARVATATILREITERAEGSVTIKETYELDGSDFEPAFAISGTGEVVFSIENGSIDSLERNYEVTMSEPNHQLMVPVSIRLSRLRGDALKEYKAEEQRVAKMANQRQQERELLEKKVPDVTNRSAVIATLRGSDQPMREMMIRKLDRERVEDDPELARVIYQDFFKSGSPIYTTKAVITRLDPEMEQTVSIAEKYDGSFDTELTGEEITEESTLKAGQIICYPRYSSWRAGRFYGAVKDVVVVISIERSPKLIALRRSDCRLPASAFIDPGMVRSSTTTLSDTR